MSRYSLQHRLFPTVMFEAQGGNVERFLSDCLHRFIPLTEVEAGPYGFCACVPAARYRSLCVLAHAHGCRLRVKQKQGVWFAARKLRRHAGAALGLLAAVLLLALGRGQIWNIEYYGVDNAAQTELSNRLFACGIYQGSFATDERLRMAEDTILRDSSHFAALALNYGKGRLLVEAQPITEDPTMYEGQDWDILASESGVIRSVEVYSGVSAVKTGQTVQKGDVLVLSSWPDQQGALVPAPARASIMAYVEKNCVTACPLVQQSEVAVSTRVDSLAICIGGSRIWLKKGSDENASPAQQGVRLFGMALPITVYKTVSVQYQTQQIRLTDQQAQLRCIDALNALLYAQLPGMQVLSRDYTWEVRDDTVYCTLHLRAYADIAAASAQETDD